MEKQFFSTNGDESIFEGLEISKETALCEEYMGKYLVISVSLKGIDALDFEMAFRMGARAVRRTASKVQYLLERDALSESDKNALKRKNKLRVTVSRAIDILPCRNDRKRNICPVGVELIYVVNNGDIFPCASVKRKQNLK